MVQVDVMQYNAVFIPCIGNDAEANLGGMAEAKISRGYMDVFREMKNVMQINSEREI